jgi:Na+/phosphate symporter
VGAVTRKKEIRQRRRRQAKRRRERLRELRQVLQKGRTHQDRVRIAGEFRDRLATPGA